MEKDESKIWEKHYGKKVCTQKLNIEGYKKPIEFDIYDGYAVCKDHKGHRFDMCYPQMKIIRDSKEMIEEIMGCVKDIECEDEISPLHSLIAFNTLYVDGVEVKSV